VIPNLQEVARHFGFNPSFVALAVGGALTGLVLLAQLIARWFGDWDS